MKYQKKKIYTFLITFIAFITTVYIWNNLYIPYKPNGIIGEYSINKYHALNDPIKYLLFIIVPSLVYLICNILIEKNKINYLLNFNYITKDKNDNDITLILSLIILSVLLILEFLSINFPYHKIDLFHSGQRLSAAYKNYIDGSLWSGSYVTGGIFIEILGSKLAWFISGVQSIGSMRVYEILLIFITKITLIFLAYEITKISSIKTILKPYLFIFVSLNLLFLIDYDINSSDIIESRELPNIILLILFIFILKNNFQKINYILMIIGFFSISSFFWSVDRAVVHNFLLIFIIFYLLINKSYKNILFLLIFVIINWILFAVLLKQEFYYFLSNTKNIITESNNIYGIIHPNLFSNDQNSTRATKTLLVILFSVIYSINLLFNSKISEHKNKVFLIFLSLASVLAYIYALGRSDGGHIKQAFGYPLIFLIVLFSNFVFKWFGNFDFVKFKKINIFVFPIIILLLGNAFLNIEFNRIKYFKKNLVKYINEKDNIFLENKEINFIQRAKDLIRSEECIQLYTYDSILLYLLKKPNCSKYYFLRSIGTEESQKILINEMKKTNVIISNGVTDNWSIIPFEKRYPILDKYIKNNYTKVNDIDGRDILILNN